MGLPLNLLISYSPKKRFKRCLASLDISVKIIWWRSNQVGTNLGVKVSNCFRLICVKSTNQKLNKSLHSVSAIELQSIFIRKRKLNENYFQLLNINYEKVSD